MRLDKWLTSTLALALVAGSTVLVGTASAFDEEKIKVSQLPKKVLKAAKKAFPKAIVIGAAKETEDGETIFEVLLNQDGKSIDLGINEDGEIEAIEKEIEVEDLPKAVTRAAAKKFPKGKILKVEEVSDEDDMVVYELSIKVGKKDPVEVVMSPNGKILEAIAEEDDAKGEAKAKKKDKDEKDEVKADKKDKDEKGEVKAKKKDMEDDEDDKKGETKAKKKDKDEKDEVKTKEKDMDDDEEDDEDDDEQEKKTPEQEKKDKD